VGLIVNPTAGLGGAVGLYGSDGQELQAQALARGATPKAEERCRSFLDHMATLCSDAPSRVHWLTSTAPMGAQCFDQGHWFFETLPLIPSKPTSAADTRSAAAALRDANVDCLLFVGGDGTARDVMAAVGTKIPVLGIPAGVKMHSGVFAVSPRTAALVMELILNGGLVASVLREVRDFDPATSSLDEITVRSFGELRVPEAGGYVQQTKVGGKESEPLAVQEICAWVMENLPAKRDVVIGPGSTCLAIKQALGLVGTLRGCDVCTADGDVWLNVNAAQLQSLASPYLIVSFTRSQGFLFGRGNQQLSAEFIQGLKLAADVCVVGTRTKLHSLQQRPLLVDTGDAGLDAQLSGLIEVVVGYEDALLYRVSAGEN